MHAVAVGSVMKGLVDGDETARVTALRDDVTDSESEFDRHVLIN